jgi:hypothetical protein
VEVDVFFVTLILAMRVVAVRIIGLVSSVSVVVVEEGVVDSVVDDGSVGWLYPRVVTLVRTLCTVVAVAVGTTVAGPCPIATMTITRPKIRMNCGMIPPPVLVWVDGGGVVA